MSVFFLRWLACFSVSAGPSATSALRPGPRLRAAGAGAPRRRARAGARGGGVLRDRARGAGAARGRPGGGVILLGDRPLTLADLEQVARGSTKVAIGTESAARMKKA